MVRVEHDHILFSFPNVHPDAKFEINFQRTLRIPDDGKKHRLPPGLGSFPLRNVDALKQSQVPEDYKTRGGVVLPMFQSEALWIVFRGTQAHARGTAYPFAVKVSAGKRSAITGGPWTEGLSKDDYCIVPKQPWLDGFSVEKGTIRQFVAAPLGMGVTVEEQLTGKAEFGGLQIEVFPMKADFFNRRFPVRPPSPTRHARSAGFHYGADGIKGLDMLELCESGPVAAASFSMGMGAGGQMTQTIFEDEFGLDAWETTASERLFVHLANSLAWRKLTGEEPPSTPMDAKMYTAHGLPWFDYYAEGAAIGGGDVLSKVKPAQSFPGVVPDNEPLAVPETQVKDLSYDKNKVRTGQW